MRWQSPKEGDYRTFCRFAIFPVGCDDGTKLWLEWYVVKQEYKLTNFDWECRDFLRSSYGWKDVSRVPCHTDMP